MPTLSAHGLEVSQNWQFCPYLFRSNESLLWVQVHCCNEVAVACFERGTPCHAGDCEPISDIVRDQQATLAWPGCNLDILYISIILCIQAFLLYTGIRSTRVSHTVWLSLHWTEQNQVILLHAIPCNTIKYRSIVLQSLRTPFLASSDQKL